MLPPLTRTLRTAISTSIASSPTEGREDLEERAALVGWEATEGVEAMEAMVLPAVANWVTEEMPPMEETAASAEMARTVG